MKRFIRYLYEYNQGKRLRNVGFIKVEQGEQECAVHIHGKGLHMKGEMKLNIYLFYETDNECVGIWQGTVDNVDPAINYRLYYTKDDVGTPENFMRINGIILESETGHRYAAVWDDMPVDIDNMQIWRQRPVSIEERMQQEVTQREERMDEAPKEEGPKEEKLMEEEPRRESGESQTSEEMQGTPRNVSLEEQGIDSSETQSARPFKCTKIQRSELAQLPRCEWKWSNNSFLLHGYYNYHHLVFLDDGEGLRLGVPGIYHPQEAKAAGAFGFSEFIPVQDIGVELTDEERNDQEKFGYWCRYVKRQMPR